MVPTDIMKRQQTSKGNAELFQSFYEPRMHLLFPLFPLLPCVGYNLRSGWSKSSDPCRNVQQHSMIGYSCLVFFFLCATFAFSVLGDLMPSANVTPLCAHIEEGDLGQPGDGDAFSKRPATNRNVRDKTVTRQFWFVILCRFTVVALHCCPN